LGTKKEFDRLKAEGPAEQGTGGAKRRSGDEEQVRGGCASSQIKVQIWRILEKIFA